MTSSVLFCFLFFFSGICLSAKDTLSFSDNQDAAMQIMKLREDLLLSLSQDAPTDTRTIEDILKIKLSGEGRVYEYLYPREQELLLFLASAWEEITQKTATNQFDFHDEKAYAQLLKEKRFEQLDYYGEDSLIFIILTHIKTHKESIKTLIAQSNLPSPDQSFLHLYLESLLAYENLEQTDTSKIRQMSEEFLSQYPESTYQPFVYNSINPSFRASRMGFGGGFYSGYSLYSGKFSRLFANGVMVGLNLDINRDNFYLLVDFFIISSAINNAFTYADESWTKNLSTTINSWKIGLGYPILRTSKGLLLPFISATSMGVTAVREDSFNNPGDDNEFRTEKIRRNFRHLPSATAGMSYILQLKKIQLYGTYHDAFRSHYSQNHWYLKFTLGVSNPEFDRLDDQFKTTNIFFHVGIGTHITPLKKIFH